MGDVVWEEFGNTEQVVQAEEVLEVKDEDDTLKLKEYKINTIGNEDRKEPITEETYMYLEKIINAKPSNMMTDKNLLRVDKELAHLRLVLYRNKKYQKIHQQHVDEFIRKQTEGLDDALAVNDAETLLRQAKEAQLTEQLLKKKKEQEEAQELLVDHFQNARQVTGFLKRTSEAKPLIDMAKKGKTKSEFRKMFKKMKQKEKDPFGDAWFDERGPEFALIEDHAIAAEAYTGGRKQGARHGVGKQVYSNGDMYEGSWNFDKQDGLGQYEYADGSMYQGQWRVGNRHGLGRQDFSNGSVYEGDWDDDHRSGMGVMFYKKINCFHRGEWKNNQRHGYGIITWARTGSYYIGSFLNDLKHGKGVYYELDVRTNIFHTKLMVYSHNKLQSVEETQIRKKPMWMLEAEASQRLARAAQQATAAVVLAVTEQRYREDVDALSKAAATTESRESRPILSDTTVAIHGTLVHTPFDAEAGQVVHVQKLKRLTHIALSKDFAVEIHIARMCDYLEAIEEKNATEDGRPRLYRVTSAYEQQLAGFRRYMASKMQRWFRKWVWPRVLCRLAMRSPQSRSDGTPKSFSDAMTSESAAGSARTDSTHSADGGGGDGGGDGGGGRDGDSSSGSDSDDGVLNTVVPSALAHTSATTIALLAARQRRAKANRPAWTDEFLDEWESEISEFSSSDEDSDDDDDDDDDEDDSEDDGNDDGDDDGDDVVVGVSKGIIDDDFEFEASEDEDDVSSSFNRSRPCTSNSIIGSANKSRASTAGTVSDVVLSSVDSRPQSSDETGLKQPKEESEGVLDVLSVMGKMKGSQSPATRRANKPASFLPAHKQSPTSPPSVSSDAVPSTTINDDSSSVLATASDSQRTEKVNRSQRWSRPDLDEDDDGDDGGSSTHEDHPSNSNGQILQQQQAQKVFAVHRRGGVAPSLAEAATAKANHANSGSEAGSVRLGGADESDDDDDDDDDVPPRTRAPPERAQRYSRAEEVTPEAGTNPKSKACIIS